MTEPLAYLNGRMVPVAEARLPVYDAGVVMGATVTEMSRTFHQRPYRLGDHLDRLLRALRLTGIEAGLSKEEWTAISLELLAHNGRLLPEGAESGIVQFVTAGDVATYAGMMDRPPRTTPTVCVHTFPLALTLYARPMRSGAHLVTPAVRQLPPACLDPGMKCRSRMHYYLAEREARRVDPDAFALLLDLDGRITETNAANFLMVERGRIVSPPTTYTLPGVSRATAIDLAAELRIPFAEQDISPSEAAAAEEAFLASTPYCLMPVTRINGAPVGDGKPGPVYRRLLEAWSRKVGLDIEAQILSGKFEV